MAEPSTTSSVFPYLIVRNVISSTLPAGRFNVTGRKQNNTGKEQPCPSVKCGFRTVSVSSSAAVSASIAAIRQAVNGMYTNLNGSPGRLAWRCRHAVHFGERAVACGTAADGGVAGIHPAGAHPGIHRLRRRRSAGVPTVRFRLNSITAVIRSGTPADIRKGLRPSTGRSPSHPRQIRVTASAAATRYRAAMADSESGSVAHVGAGGRSGGLRFRLVGDNRFGGQEQAGDGRGVLQTERVTLTGSATPAASRSS